MSNTVQTSEEVAEEIKCSAASDVATAAIVWVDDKQLEKLTPISRWCWQKWRQTGEGPKWYRAGSRRVIYRLDEVNAWLARDCVGGSDV